MRSPAQRNHDPLKAMGRSVLTSGQLGQHNGLPATIIVSTTLPELESGCGQAVTATGSLLPMPTVIKMASHAYHFLTIFDKDTGRALHLGRTRRIASADQRIVLHARDRGCTRPAAPWPGPTAKSITPKRIGPTAETPTSTTSPSAAPKTTAVSNPAAGAPENLQPPGPYAVFALVNGA